jgi:catechol 2,3-dioxygenase-like lactoylglutathione lyase family enzyme
MSIEVIGIAWIGIVSDDPAARDFYQHTLKLPVLESTANYAYFSIDDRARLEILASHTPTASRQNAHAPAIAFLVSDLDAALTHLRDQGVGLRSDILSWQSDTERHRWVYFADPAGNILLLLERHDQGQPG